MALSHAAAQMVVRGVPAPIWSGLQDLAKARGVSFETYGRIVLAAHALKWLSVPGKEQEDMP